MIGVGFRVIGLRLTGSGSRVRVIAFRLVGSGFRASSGFEV